MTVQTKKVKENAVKKVGSLNKVGNKVRVGWTWTPKRMGASVKMALLSVPLAVD